MGGSVKYWGGKDYEFGRLNIPVGFSRCTWSQTRGIRMKHGWQFCTVRWRLRVQWGAGDMNIQLMRHAP